MKVMVSVGIGWHGAIWYSLSSSRPPPTCADVSLTHHLCDDVNVLSVACTPTPTTTNNKRYLFGRGDDDDDVSLNNSALAQVEFLLPQA